jgi:hypothetical protein
MTRISFCGVFGCRTRSIGNRSISSSSSISHLKNCCSAFEYSPRNRANCAAASR